MAARAIQDQYLTLTQLNEALNSAGLESSNLLIGIDYTSSNTSAGLKSFGADYKNLHKLANAPNPYERAMAAILRNLEGGYDDDGLIPVYGFGDGAHEAPLPTYHQPWQPSHPARAEDQALFSLVPGGQPAKGMADVLNHYRAVTSHIKLAGPTSFAPLIHQACNIIAQNHFAFHILLILGDGELTRPSSTPDHALSAQERATVDAIIMASHYPLSIVFVGIGDGPWDRMQWLDDHLVDLGSLHDNFQFVRFADSEYGAGLSQEQRDARFALAALQEIPGQYQAMRKLGLMNSGRSLPELPLVAVMEPPEEAVQEGGLPVPLVGVLPVRPSAPPADNVAPQAPQQALQQAPRGPPPPPLARPPAYLAQADGAAAAAYPTIPQHAVPSSDQAGSMFTPFTGAVPGQPPPIARPPDY